MKNVAHKIIGDWLVVSYGENSPTEEEGREAIAAFRSVDLDRTRVLTFTKGGAPTPAQRKAMNEVLQGKELITAVVSDALMMRGVVTALGWFNSRIKLFRTSEIEDAFRYLEIPQAQYPLFRREAQRLEAELSSPTRKK